MQKAVFFLVMLYGVITIGQESKLSKAPDTIAREMLRIISGKEGEVRDWDALRNIFLSTAQLTIVNQGERFENQTETVSLEDFIELMHDEYYDKGFFEVELGSVVNEYNGIANVFQSFYSKDSENQEGRGVTSYNMVFTDGNWKISNLIWTIETDDNPIPKKYLNKN